MLKIKNITLFIMSADYKLFIFFNGTYSVKAPDTSNFFTRILSRLMFHPNNIMVKMFEHCEEEYKYYFDGPGADFFHKKKQGVTLSKIFGTFASIFDGHIGYTGIENNLAKTEKIVLEHAIRAQQQQNKKFRVFVYSYSRGGFLAYRLKKLLTKMIALHKIKIKSAHFYNIDPVIGTPFDRLRLYYHSKEKDPDIKIYSETYFSDSGNLNIWDKYISKVNTIWFSGFLFDNHQSANSKIRNVNGNHESLGGKCGHEDDHHPGKITGKIVLTDLLIKTKEEKLKFNDEWREENINAGLELLPQYQEQKLNLKDNRGYLSEANCFIPEHLQFVPSTLSLEEFNNKTSNDRDLEAKKIKRP